MQTSIGGGWRPKGTSREGWTGERVWATRLPMDISIERLCIENGLKMTGPRRVIARVLSEATDHPDVDELHRRANRIDPRHFPGHGVPHGAAAGSEGDSRAARPWQPPRTLRAER